MKRSILTTTKANQAIQMKPFDKIMTIELILTLIKTKLQHNNYVFFFDKTFDRILLFSM